MLLVAGSYERFLFGFDAGTLATASHPDTNGSVGAPAALPKHFTFAAHQNGVKCVASGGHFLASGGNDDQIHLYDMKHDQDLGFLMNPGEGAVPCLQFFCPQGPGAAPSHMLSGSADGSIAIWQAGCNWQHLKQMKGHKGAVNGLSLHPSGRVALSVAHDSSLRMWDLSRGRCTYTAKLEVEAQAVAWAPGGEAYTLTCGSKVTMHSVGNEGALLATLNHPRRVLVSLQQEQHTLLTGLEDGAVKVWDLRSNSVVLSLDRAHATRIRGLVAVRPGLSAVPEQLATAASDGSLKVWDMRQLSSSRGGSTQPSPAPPPCLAEANTGARLTCLCSVDPKGPGALPPQRVVRPAEGSTAAAAAQKPAKAARQDRQDFQVVPSTDQEPQSRQKDQQQQTQQKAGGKARLKGANAGNSVGLGKGLKQGQGQAQEQGQQVDTQDAGLKQQKQRNEQGKHSQAAARPDASQKPQQQGGRQQGNEAPNTSKSSSGKVRTSFGAARQAGGAGGGGEIVGKLGGRPRASTPQPGDGQAARKKKALLKSRYSSAPNTPGSGKRRSGSATPKALGVRNAGVRKVARKG
ncbi:WD40-repeat-containing domain protein [Haematococcus lacustris]